MSDNDEVTSPGNPVSPDKSISPGNSASGERSIWMRGVLMLVFGLFFGIAETLLVIAAVVQFVWMGITKERNRMIVDFGNDMGKWLGQVAQFQTGASEDLPFPWAPWGKD